jgi:putative oxidoreductase
MTTGTLQQQHQPGFHALHHDPDAARIAVELEEARELEVLKSARKRDERLWLGGRLMMAIVFLTAATAKALTFQQTSEMIALQGFAGPDFLLGVAIAIEAFAGAMLALGMQTRKVATTLIVWVAFITLALHHDLGQAWNRASALSNMALIAGLLFLLAHGAGTRSVDQARRRKETEAERT